MKKFPVRWSTAIPMVIFHVATIVALFFPTWQRVLLATLVWFIFGCIGVTMTFHRLLTHKSYKVHPWTKKALAVIGCMSLQGEPIAWVAWHTLHHRHTEVKGVDPHTPLDGKWWSHMDWLIHVNPAIQEESFLSRWAAELYVDPFFQGLRRFYLLPAIGWGAACFLLGGVQSLLWGFVLPITFSWHFTWLINSGTHLWGYRTYETNDNSRNNFWIALFTFGEGWHNNHHAAASRVRHGLTWREPDPTWWMIEVMNFFHLAWDLRY